MNDSILFWNGVALDAARLDFTPARPEDPLAPQQPGPTATSRALAIVHLAMHDAYLGALFPGQPTHGTYAAGEQPAASDVTIARLAVSTAACMALSVLFSRNTALFVRRHGEYAASLGATVAQADEGQRWGALVATRMLQSRDGDQAASKNAAPYAPSPETYRHRADPLDSNQGFLGARWGDLAPFLVNQLTDGMTIPFKAPPASNSQEYADDFNGVKQLGRLRGSSRTPDQTAIGVFWAYDGARDIGVPPRLYNQAVRAMVEAKGSTDEALHAKLFAAINAGMADAGIFAWYEKYRYNLWRPVLGIREADAGWGPTGQGDANTGTAGDPEWMPLGAPRSNTAAVEGYTPPFPAYPSGHASFGTVALLLAQTLLQVDDSFTFSFVSEEFNGVNRGAQGVRPVHRRTMTVPQAVEENILSRVYLGVHWEFDGREGERIGRALAKLIGAHPLFG